MDRYALLGEKSACGLLLETEIKGAGKNQYACGLLFSDKSPGVRKIPVLGQALDSGNARRGGVALKAGAAIPAGVVHRRIFFVVHDFGDHRVHLIGGVEGDAANVSVGQDVITLEHGVVVVAVAAVTGQVFVPGRNGVGAGGVAEDGDEFQGGNGFVLIEGLKTALDAASVIAADTGVQSDDVITLLAPPLQQRGDARRDTGDSGMDGHVGAQT